MGEDKLNATLELTNCAIQGRFRQLLQEREMQPTMHEGVDLFHKAVSDIMALLDTLELREK